MPYVVIKTVIHAYYKTYNPRWEYVMQVNICNQRWKYIQKPNNSRDGHM